MGEVGHAKGAKEQEPNRESDTDYKERRGLWDKYTVTRNDGSPNHTDCRYFVLDLSHDPAARLAARSYQIYQRRENPLLAELLGELLNSMWESKREEILTHNQLSLW